MLKGVIGLHAIHLSYFDREARASPDDYPERVSRAERSTGCCGAR